MMNIVKMNPEQMTFKELYDLTKSPDIAKMSNIKGQELEIEQFICYTDASQDGEEIRIVSIKTPDGECYATNSPTFTREFLDLCEMCETAKADYPKKIVVKEGTSRNNRKYITCVYVE